MRNFARGWTLELKDRKIRVNCTSPGAIDTPDLATTTALTAQQTEQATAQFTTQIPIGRKGMPEEIAAAVVFLFSLLPMKVLTSPGWISPAMDEWRRSDPARSPLEL